MKEKETWNNKTSEFIETPEKQIQFVKEIESICRKYGLSISHEDGYGSFEICNFNQQHIDALKAANTNWL